MGHIVDGSYMYKYPYYMIALFMIDIALMSLIYFMTGLTFSALIDDNVLRPLDRSLGNLIIFFQSMGDILLTVFCIYFLLHFIPKIPCIVPDAPPEHIIFRNRGGDVILAFAIVAAQLLYLDKLRYLYNDVKDGKEIIAEEIRQNWIICQDGTVAPPTGDFSCQP